MNREPRLWMIFSGLIALFLSVLPLPGWLESLRPAFLVLAVLYFSITAPRAGGLALGFFAGARARCVPGPGARAARARPLAGHLHRRAGAPEDPLEARVPAVADRVLRAARCTSSCCSPSMAGPAIPSPNPLRWVHTFSGALIWPHRHRAARARPLAALRSSHGTRRPHQGSLERAAHLRSARVRRGHHHRDARRCSWSRGCSCCRCCGTTTTPSSRRVTASASSRFRPRAGSSSTATAKCIADNQPAYQLELVPEEVPDLDEDAERPGGAGPRAASKTSTT